MTTKMMSGQASPQWVRHDVLWSWPLLRGFSAAVRRQGLGIVQGPAVAFDVDEVVGEDGGLEKSVVAAAVLERADGGFDAGVVAVLPGPGGAGGGGLRGKGLTSGMAASRSCSPLAMTEASMMKLAASSLIRTRWPNSTVARALPR
jgi:hypothetical protein